MLTWVTSMGTAGLQGDVWAPSGESSLSEHPLRAPNRLRLARGKHSKGELREARPEKRAGQRPEAPRAVVHGKSRQGAHWAKTRFRRIPLVNEPEGRTGPGGGRQREDLWPSSKWRRAGTVARRAGSGTWCLDPPEWSSRRHRRGGRLRGGGGRVTGEGVQHSARGAALTSRGRGGAESRPRGDRRRPSAPRRTAAWQVGPAVRPRGRGPGSGRGGQAGREPTPALTAAPRRRSRFPLSQAAPAEVLLPPPEAALPPLPEAVSAQGLEKILLLTVPPPPRPAAGQKAPALHLLQHKEAQGPARFPASLGELARAPRRGGRLRAQQQHSPHLSPTQATSEGLAGLELRHRRFRWGLYGLLCATGRLQPRGGGHDACGRGAPRGPGHPCGAGRAHSQLGATTPPTQRPGTPSPAARNAPLTGAQRREKPCLPPFRPADKAHTAARTPRPEVAGRLRPGDFRCRSRRAGASRPLGGADFRPGEGGAPGTPGCCRACECGLFPKRRRIREVSFRGVLSADVENPAEASTDRGRAVPRRFTEAPARRARALQVRAQSRPSGEPSGGRIGPRRTEPHHGSGRAH
ncbi:hypothetical protein HPG69_014469 [Diceros bicornis minor]|uniref:Uncharacterized protein n=1 Tax=Diceros bicornis minor TaxID=77932 RepID=A0A7J7FA81_DICBM|nr:hypothetical protein HPG69_014469 [Diceros bicornis minor]